MKHTIITELLNMLCLVSVCATANVQVLALKYQDELTIRVEKAADELLGDGVRKAYADFRAMGDAAIPEILKLIQNDENQPPHKKVIRNTRLVNVIAEYESPKADVALIKLLSHKRPFIRGIAAVCLGTRKSKVALPHLIHLLDDQGVYLNTYVSHGEDYDTLVRDVVIEALEKITRKEFPKSEDKEKQVAAWKQWWQKQQKKTT